jgi:hypothetical protein
VNRFPRFVLPSRSSAYPDPLASNPKPRSSTCSDPLAPKLQSLARFKPTVVIQRNPRLKRSEFPDVDVGTSSKVVLHPWFDGYFQARLLPLHGGNKTARGGASAQQRERGSAERSGSSTARGKVAGSTGGLGSDSTMRGGVGQTSLLSAGQHAIALPMKMGPLVAPPALVVLPVVLPSDAAVLPISRGGGQLQSLYVSVSLQPLHPFCSAAPPPPSSSSVLLMLLAVSCVICTDGNAWGRRGAAQRYASLGQKQNQHLGRAAFR